MGAGVLVPLWQTFVSGLKVYEQACVQGVEESFSGMADSDGTDQSLESFAIQVLNQEFGTFMCGCCCLVMFLLVFAI